MTNMKEISQPEVKESQVSKPEQSTSSDVKSANSSELPIESNSLKGEGSEDAETFDDSKLEKPENNQETQGNNSNEQGHLREQELPLENVQQQEGLKTNETPDFQSNAPLGEKVDNKRELDLPKSSLEEGGGEFNNLPDNEKEYNNGDLYGYDGYTDEELIKQFEEDDPGYINGDVLDYDSPEYKEHGTHRIDWGKDNADMPHNETLQQGKTLSRVGDENGHYFGDQDMNYNDRQLPYIEGKQPIKNYEVLKPLNVEQSTVAKQPWGPEMEGDAPQQYKSEKTAKELVDEGYLRELPDKNTSFESDNQAVNETQIHDLNGEHTKDSEELLSKKESQSDTVDTFFQEDELEKQNDVVDYSRPTGYRAGVRDQVWENAKDEHGRVRDPVSGRYMSKNQSWDMGHKPGYEFKKHQESAMERGITRKQFLDEHNNPDHYRPELPFSNRSHKGEDKTGEYFGD